MPKLGLTMEEGSVVEWLVELGEEVRRGEPLLIVESEKSEVEVEAFANGRLAAIYVEPGSTVAVGTLLAAISEAGEEFDAQVFAGSFAAECPAPGVAEQSSGSRLADAGAARSTPRLKAAPAARALARKLGLNLAAVAGKGPGGRITVEDVAAAASDKAGSVREPERFGSGEAVCLIPGFTMDRGAWAAQLPALVPRYSALVLENPPQESIAEMAANVHAVRKKLDAGPTVLVGASMGAAIAVQAALDRPYDLWGLVLVSPFLTLDARASNVLDGWAGLAEAGVAAEARALAMLPWMLGPRFLADEKRLRPLRKAWTRSLSATPPQTLRAHAAAIRGWLGKPLSDLEELTLPALVVVGDKDLLVPPSEARRIAAALPNARVEVLENVGHAVTVEAADRFNELLLDFLGDVAGGEAA